MFAEAEVAPVDEAILTLDFDPDQPRDPDGRWSSGRAGTSVLSSDDTIAQLSARFAYSAAMKSINNLLRTLLPLLELAVADAS